MKYILHFKIMLVLILVCFSASGACAKDLVIGMLLAGSSTDNSYNQFHLDAARKAAEQVANIKIIYIERANPIDRPRGVTVPAMVDDLVQKGATVIIANAYEMGLGITTAAPKYPHVKFIQINGGDALIQASLPNVTNVSLVFENAQMLTGFAVGMATSNGRIAFLGASPNPDSYRQASAAYLGAKYAWEKVRKLNSKDFQFKVKWMGNWFNNLSPGEDTRVSTFKLFESGADVVIGGNYNTDVITAAKELQNANKKLLAALVANPFMPENACPFMIGFSYYNWLPVYEDLFAKAKQNTLEPIWLRYMPDMFELNRFGYSNVGFIPYDALNINGKVVLDEFMWSLATGEVNLFAGPLRLKDGTDFAADGELPDEDALRNMNQLLEGIDELPLTPVEKSKGK